MEPSSVPSNGTDFMSGNSSERSLILHEQLAASLTDKFVGVVISSIAAFLYASGLCVQKAALTLHDTGEAPAGCGRSCCRRYSTANWALGLAIYAVGGLFLGTLALRYIPLSLTSSIFSSVLVFNAIVARVWLKESIQPVDFVCYFLIIVGIIMASYYLPDSPKKIDVHELNRLWLEPIGIVYWTVVISVLVVLQVGILGYLERRYQVDGKYTAGTVPHHIYKAAMVSYPVVLGIWEGVAYIALKAANDIFDHIGKGRRDQTNHWLFWFGCSIALPMTIVIVIWVRKAYQRFPTTQIFPLELGSLTIVSVNGGLLFYKEYLPYFGGKSISREF